MVRDEYNRLPDEFSNSGEEFNRNYQKVAVKDAKDKKKLTRKIKRSIQFFTCAVVTVTTIDVYSPIIVFGKEDVQKEENHQSEIIDNSLDLDENNVIIVDENNDVIEDEYIEVVCDACQGTGIICPGDPDFGYDRGNGFGYAGCHGTGYSSCPDIRCNGGYVPCSGCKGSGEPCNFCNGTGIEICEFCNGTTIAVCISFDSHSVCEKCNGEKVVKTKK